MAAEAQAARGAVDLVSILGTAGGSSGQTGLLVYLLARRNGQGHATADHGNDRLERKLDKLIELQQQQWVSLAEIKGALAQEH